MGDLLTIDGYLQKTGLPIKNREHGHLWLKREYDLVYKNWLSTILGINRLPEKEAVEALEKFYSKE